MRNVPSGRRTGSLDSGVALSAVADPGTRGDASSEPQVEHHFTVDVEEYFQVSAFEPYVSRADWGELQSRVAIGVHLLLALLQRHRARATFFVLGWVAEHRLYFHHPHGDGHHRIVSHGWAEGRGTDHTADEFRWGVRQAI